MQMVILIVSSGQQVRTWHTIAMPFCFQPVLFGFQLRAGSSYFKEEVANNLSIYHVTQ